MKIEQILEKIKNSTEQPRITAAELCGEEYDNDLFLKPEECKKLYDYITNLQQENQELNDSITWWNNRFNAVQRDYEDYKSRIEKAVEYIKEHQRKDEFLNLNEWQSRELLNILNRLEEK